MGDVFIKSQGIFALLAVSAWIYLTPSAWLAHAELPACEPGAIVRVESELSTEMEHAFAKTQGRKLSDVRERIYTYDVFQKPEIHADIPDGIPKHFATHAEHIYNRVYNPDQFRIWFDDLLNETAATMARHSSAKVRAMLDQGKVNQGVFLQVLQKRAYKSGWGKIGYMRGRKSEKEFFEELAKGDLFWDTHFISTLEHGRDPHVIQLLYATEGLPPGAGREFLKFMGSDSKAGHVMWRRHFDGFADGLASPEDVNFMLQEIFPRKKKLH